MSDRSNLVDLLPHRPPFRLLDEARLDSDGTLRAQQAIPTTNPILDSHFPGFPIWPGALIIEAMAQTTAVLFLSAEPSRASTDLPVLGSVDCLFMSPVLPGETLHYRTKLERRLEDLAIFSVTARKADGQVVARTRMTAGIVDRSSLGLK